MCQAVPGPRIAAFLSLALVSMIALRPQVAHACGCFSPPVPQPADTDFAVNQQSEVIIFEVEQGNPILLEPATVTAHVMIKYAGDPAQFAWLVPVPNVPDLELSEAGVFGWLDSETTPGVGARNVDLCPPQQYRCEVHPPPFCPSPNMGAPNAGGLPATPTDPGISDGDFAASDPGGGAPPDVMVFKREQIGSYDTVVFGAGDAQGTIDWLNDEGFIVNDTMTPFMQPYLDAGMVFVASKLVPGADVDEIRPLKMRYIGTDPMVPLQLTAVAAEPHLTVTSFIFGNGLYEPVGHPMVEIPIDEITTFANRNNYPMLLSRVADEAGGDGFVREYAGAPPVYQLDDPNGCCSAGFDLCFVEQNGVCECPNTDIDAVDCAADEELTRTLDLIDQLSTSYTSLTRLTLRISPEEMTFDPVFSLGNSGGTPPTSLVGEAYQLSRCGGDVIDQERFEEISAVMACATTYCGNGRCAGAGNSAGCICDDGHVARAFTDLDGRPSVTCVPEQPMVDFSAGGLEVADVCTAVGTVEMGDCVDVGGFPAMVCPVDTVAVAVDAGGQAVPECLPIVAELADPGGLNSSVELQELEVCAPAPPSCPAATGWLEEIEGLENLGVQCESSIPDSSWFEVPAEPTCADADRMRDVPTLNMPMETTDERPDTEVLPGDDDDDRVDPGDDVAGGSTKGSSGLCAVGGKSMPAAAWSLLLLGAVLARRRWRAVR